MNRVLRLQALAFNGSKQAHPFSSEISIGCHSDISIACGGREAY